MKIAVTGKGGVGKQRLPPYRGQAYVRKAETPGGGWDPDANLGWPWVFRGRAGEYYSHIKNERVNPGQDGCRP